MIAITPIQTGAPVVEDAAPGERRAVHRLARLEGLRLLRHPAFVVGCVLTLAYFLQSRSDTNATYLGLIGGGALGPGLGLLIAANMATLRARADDAEELLEPAPLSVADRTRALALAVAAPTVVTTAVVVLAGLVVRATSGITVAFIDGYDEAWPSAIELAQVPASVAFFGMIGIALGRRCPYRLASVALGIASFFFLIPAYFWTPGGWVGHLSPLLDPSQPHHWVQWTPSYGYNVVHGFDLVAMAWHIAYLVGLTAAAFGVALGRHSSAPIVRRALTSGLAVAAIAGYLQVP